jgi:predicted RNase H-like nuclease (RuvC/YqgF family)
MMDTNTQQNDALINEYIQSLSKKLTDKTMDGVLLEAKLKLANKQVKELEEYIVTLRQSFEDQQEEKDSRSADDVSGLVETNAFLENENDMLKQELQKAKQVIKELKNAEPKEVLIDDKLKTSNDILVKELSQADKKIDSLKKQLAEYTNKEQEKLNGDNNQAEEIGNSELSTYN